MDPSRFGYVHFDFLDLPREGWLARHGEPARRIVSPAEIPSDGIFWCNLDWQHFHRSSPLGRMGHLRHAGYLPVRPSDALAELGIDEDLLGSEEITAILARCFGNVMCWASSILTSSLPEIPEERHFTRGSLRDDFVPLFSILEFPKNEEVHALLEGQSYHSIASTLAPYRRDAIRVLVRRPRLKHALDILSSPSPAGPYRFLDTQELGQIDEIISRPQPALCRIRVRNPDERLFELYGFSNTIDRNRRSYRAWSPHAELDALRRMADLEINGGWLGRAYRLLGSILPESVDPILNDRMVRLSWSMGVCAEALWRAVLVPPEKPRQSRGTQAKRQGDISWQGLWAKAADKLILFPSVSALAERGYDVSSYGFGWILCSVDENQLDEFMNDAAELGLIPRIHDMNKSIVLTKWGGARMDMPYASLVYGRETDRILALDAIAESPRERWQEIVLSVFEAVS